MNERSYESLLYGITANTVNIIMRQNGWSENETIERFTSSRIYSLLEKEETKVWHYSAYMLAELFSEEREGRLCLPEV